MSYVLDEFYCPECDYREDLLQRRSERVSEWGECKNCGHAPLKKGIGCPHFALVVTHGGTTTNAIAKGHITQDQMDREKARLRKRSLAYCLSKEGTEKRMAQKARIEQRMNISLPSEPFLLNKYR